MAKQQKDLYISNSFVKTLITTSEIRPKAQNLATKVNEIVVNKTNPTKSFNENSRPPQRKLVWLAFEIKIIFKPPLIDGDMSRLINHMQAQ